MEYLDRIILFLSCIFDIYVFYDFFNSYFELKMSYIKHWKRIIVGVFAVGFLFLVNTYGNTYINLLCSIIIIWTYLTILFQVDFGTRILYFTVAYMVGLGCEFLFGILLSIPRHMQMQNSVVDLSDIPWYIFAMKLLTYILLAIIKQYFGRSKNAISNRIFIYYLCIPVSCLGIMLLTYYAGFVGTMELSAKVLLSVSFVLMLFGNIFVLYAFNRYSEELYKNAEQKLIISQQKMDLQYYSQVEKMDNKYQEFIHDISHHLKTIGELAKENKNNNIISILQDLNIQLENNVLTVYSENPVINAILSEKKSIAKKYGGDIDIYVEPGTNLCNISDVDVITMLSNLLDNALRAMKEANNKYIMVRIYSENEGCFNIIKIINSYTGKIICTDFGFVSTKNEAGIHGIGIKSVVSTAEKYNGYLECFVDDELFTAVLILSTL